MKNLIYTSVAIILMVGLIIGCAAPAPAPAPAPKPAPAPAPAPSPAPAPKPEPIVLKAVTFLPVMADDCAMFMEYVKRVNEQAKGELTIDVLGGPEVIGPFDQLEACHTGVVDVAFTCGYHQNEIPEILLPTIFKGGFREFREAGGLDYLRELHRQKFNILYLGAVHQMAFYLYSNVKVETPYDLAGLAFRSVGLYDPFLKKLGVTPVFLPMGEVYTAMERGVVDGYGWSALTSAFAWPEVTKYRIDHPLWYPSMGTFAMVNLDRFNSLPKHMQDLLEDTRIAMEPEIEAFFADLIKKDLEAQENAGIEPIKFSPADAEWYDNLSYQAHWEDLKGVVSPESYAKMKEICEKVE